LWVVVSEEGGGANGKERGKEKEGHDHQVERRRRGIRKRTLLALKMLQNMMNDIIVIISSLS